jgi:hypothetical protein
LECEKFEFQPSDRGKNAMTNALRNAFDQASALPEAQQETLAAIVLEEMASESKWQQAFDSSQDTLARMAAEAITEDERGETRDLDELL